MFIPLDVMADEDWSSYDNIDNAWDGQKAITNKQFEETMNASKYAVESIKKQLDSFNP